MTPEEWIEKWPKYCTKCGGWGQITWEDNHGIPGPGERVTDVCDCVYDGVCPRCAATLDDPKEDEANCSACGWTDDDPDGCPGDPRDDGYEEPWDEDEGAIP